MTLAELISERRAQIEAFERDTYGHAEHNISGVNDAIEQTPIASKADALAALDLIRDEFDPAWASPCHCHDRGAAALHRSREPGLSEHEDRDCGGRAW